MELKSQAVFVVLPMSATKVKIVDFETGEIVIRTPSLLKPY